MAAEAVAFTFTLLNDVLGKSADYAETIKRQIVDSQASIAKIRTAYTVWKNNSNLDVELPDWDAIDSSCSCSD